MAVCTAKVYDTLLLHHLCFPDLAHDLGFIASQLLQKQAWKHLAGTDELTYNCRDTDSTLQIANLLIPMARHEKVLKLYEEVQVPLARICALMTETGFRIDPARLKTVRADLESKSKELEQQLPAELQTREVPIRKRVLAPPGTLSPKTKKPLKYVMMDSTETVTPWKSSDVLKTYFYETCKLPVQTHAKTNEATTDKTALPKLIRAASKADYTKEHGLEKTQAILRALRALQNLRQMASLLSTFVKEAWEDTGVERIHASFSVHGTSSGRLSCVDGETPVLTSKGITFIRDLRVGDLVWTHRLRWRPVERVWIKGLDEMYTLKLSNGESLTCTLDHRLLRHNVNKQDVGSKLREHRKDGSSIQSVYTDHGESRRGTGFNLPQRRLRTSKASIKSGVQSPTETSVLHIQDGLKKSHEGNERVFAPQLEGRGIRWERLSDIKAREEKNFCSQNSYGEITGFRASSGTADTPHRRKQGEQRPGQSGDSDTCWTCQDSRDAKAGLESVTIEEIYYSGVREVFDITVADDSSYLSAGVFSHNSSAPNLQNIPESVRCIYIPSYTDWVIFDVDFSSLENRLTAWFSQDYERLERLNIPGFSEHKYNASVFFGIPIEEVIKDNSKDAPYGKGKRISHGTSYGMGPMKISRLYDLPFAEVKELHEKWKAANPKTVAWQLETAEKAKKDGYLTTPFGRKRWFYTDSAYTESISFLPQSTGADLVFRCMIALMYDRIGWPESQVQKLVQFYKPLPRPAQLLVQVHDSLVGQAPLSLMPEVVDTLVRVMSQPWPELGGYSIPAEPKVGNSWGEGQPWKT